MDYIEDLLSRFVNQLERRKESNKPLTLSLKKLYPDYRDNFSESFDGIHAAVQTLQGWGMITAEQDVQGYYTKLTMALSHCTQAYEMLHRIPKTQALRQQTALVQDMLAGRTGLIAKVGAAFLADLQEGKFPGYGIGQNTEKLRDILLILQKIDTLQTETYVRNFSEAIFHDSKRFQALQSTVEHILLDYTDEILDEASILQQYDLYQNPTYVHFKGGWHLYTAGQMVAVEAFPGGISLPATALPAITRMELTTRRVISVENLTTYHDMPETDAVLYLGGFPNRLRVSFLKQLARNEPQAEFFHWGDLDPYGFLILENLRCRTGIPFRPMRMDLDTLRTCWESGHYRKLEKQDEKLMHNPMLQRYADVFGYMQAHDCKAEQECFAAMQLTR